MFDLPSKTKNERRIYRQFRKRFNISKKLETRKLTIELTPRVKQELIYPLTRRFKVNGEKRKLFDIIILLAQSLVKFYSKETTELYLPHMEHAYDK
jgi:hypothetical protein